MSSPDAAFAELYDAFNRICIQHMDVLRDCEGPQSRLQWLCQQVITENTRPAVPGDAMWWALNPFPEATVDDELKIAKKLATAARKIVASAVLDPDTARDHLHSAGTRH